jgi:type VI secretion system protein ImpL
VSELYERLGVRFPLYLIVTKTDLLAGFMEMFGDLDAESRARVWGASFDCSPTGAVVGTPGQRFSEEFTALEHRLYGELLVRLENEPDLQRRAAAYRFPQEFHAIGPLVDRFMDAAFLGVQGASEPLLRGVYFTSGTQEGSPIDRVLGSLARSFKLERSAPVAAGGAGKSFFITRLLREVIFPEAGLGGLDENIDRRARRLRLAGYGAVAAAVALVGALWTSSFFANLDFLNEARAEASDAVGELRALGNARPGQETRLIHALTSLSELPGGYRDRERGTELGGGFGLAQDAKLGAQALRVYQNALREAFLPRLAISLEDDLRQALQVSKGQEEIIAADLDAYQALYAGSGANLAILEGAAIRIWKLPALDRRDLGAHLRAAIAAGAPEMRHAPDESIIRDARRRLGRPASS